MGHLKSKNKYTNQSNYLFDNSLKMQNAYWSIRNLEGVSFEGKKNDFSQEDIIYIPANNFSIIYRKVS